MRNSFQTFSTKMYYNIYTHLNILIRNIINLYLVNSVIFLAKEILFGNDRVYVRIIVFYILYQGKG